MKLTVQQNHLGGQILYRIPDHVKKRRLSITLPFVVILYLIDITGINMIFMHSSFPPLYAQVVRPFQYLSVSFVESAFEFQLLFSNDFDVLSNLAAPPSVPAKYQPRKFRQTIKNIDAIKQVAAFSHVEILENEIPKHPTIGTARILIKYLYYYKTLCRF